MFHYPGDTGGGIHAFHSVIPALKIPPFKITDMFDPESLPIEGLEGPAKLRKLKGTSAKHLDIYKAVGLEYPPDPAKFDYEIREVLLQVNPAAAETAAYAVGTDPWPKHLGVEHSQFADINMSLTWHVGSNDNAVLFQSCIPTLTTKSLLLMRWRDLMGGSHYRLIRGENLLTLIGWFSDAEEASDECCRELVGNAFSGYTFTAVALATLVAYGETLGRPTLRSMAV